MTQKLTTLRIPHLQSISGNALNKSTAKQQYSFTKSKRFQNQKQQPNYQYYDLPSTNTKRSTSMGISNRQTFNVKDGNPPPNAYELKSTLSSKGIQFIVGREEIKNYNFLKTNRNPGPGTYQLSSIDPDKIEGSKFSFRRKIPELKKQNQKFPGPGNYQLKSDLLANNKILSTQKKYRYPLIIKPPKQQVRVETDTSEPQLCSEFLNQEYPVINYKGDKTFNKEKGFKMGKQDRFNYRTTTQGPGPGEYRQFSQFIN